MTRQPFNGDEAVVFKRLESGRYKWPRHVRVGKSLKSFVSGLLTCEATERLGVASLVMEHPWLQAVDWDRIERQQYVVRLSFMSVQIWSDSDLERSCDVGPLYSWYAASVGNMAR